MAEIPPNSSQRTRRRRVRAVVHKPSDGRLQFDRDALKELLFIAGLPLLAIIAAFWFAAKYVQPAPPKSFVMSTGADGGAYHLFAQQYQKILAREKIAMELKRSAGSVENLKRLQDSSSGVVAALVQGGIVSGESPPGLSSLGAVYFEPLWIFYRGKETIDKFSQLAGKRLAVGPEGSGTRALALQLLKAGGALAPTTELLPLGTNDAANALIAGKVDAALLVGSPDAPTVQRLAKAKEIKLTSIAQAEALTRRFTFLSVLNLPRGAIDLALDLPAHDMTLLATTANLIVRDDFHPALGFLLVESASEVHKRAGVLHKANEFPSPRDGEFPLAEEARRFYQNGKPFLQRYLPFWLANFVERMFVLFVPIVAILVPAIRFLPTLIEWRAKSRVFKWYEDLKQLERDVSTQPDSAQIERYMDRLDEIEQGVNNTRVGRSYADWSYNLRGHIDLVRARLQKMEAHTS